MHPDEVIQKLQQFRDSLSDLSHDVLDSQNWSGGNKRLDRLKERMVRWLRREVSYEEAERLDETRSGLQRGNPGGNFEHRCEAYDGFLTALARDIEEDPEHWDDVINSDDGEVEQDHSSLEDPDDVDEARVFIGHGGSPHWARIQRFIETDLGLETVVFESESRVGTHIVDVLERMLEQTDCAVIVLTAEDLTVQGKARARQNVVHEVGLFQGRHGFSRTVVVLQDGVEEFSNIAGLQQIRFAGNNVEACYHELRRFLEREGFI